MRPPAQRRSIDTIVAELVGELGPAYEASIREKIGALQKHRGPLWGNRSANAKHIRDTRKDIEQLQRRLEKLPTEVLYMLFTPDFEPINDRQIEETGERAFAASQFLGGLVGRCDQLLTMTPLPGAHKNRNDLERQCAIEARMLLEGTGKVAADGGATSSFGRVASLLFEAVTGKRDQDLQRACRAVRTITIRTET
jgi:hypothetical protein